MRQWYVTGIINLQRLAAFQVSTLTDEGGRLKSGLVKGEDYDILPEPVWKALHLW